MIKGQLAILFLSSTILFVMVSCKKHQASAPNTFSATIHDTIVNASIVTAVASRVVPEFLLTAYVPQPGGDTTILQIQDYEPIPVNAPNNDPSSISFDYYDSERTFDYGGPYSSSSSPARATVTLTDIDSVHHRLTGTFSASLYKDFPPGPPGPSDSVVFTNGQFSVTYTLVP